MAYVAATDPGMADLSYDLEAGRILRGEGRGPGFERIGGGGSSTPSLSGFGYLKDVLCSADPVSPMCLPLYCSSPLKAFFSSEIQHGVDPLRPQDSDAPPTGACIYVDPGGAQDVADLCEEVWRAFLTLLNRGVRRVRIYVRASRASEWVGVSSCVLARNLVATVEVLASGSTSRDTVARECPEVVEVPVAPPTSQLRECRQVIP